MQNNLLQSKLVREGRVRVDARLCHQSLRFTTNALDACPANQAKKFDKARK